MNLLSPERQRTSCDWLSRDPVNHFLALFTPLAARLRGFGFTDVSTHVFGGVRHEPFNDLTRDEVLDTMAAWMRRVAGADRG